MTKNALGIAAVAAALVLFVLLATERSAFAWTLAGVALVAVIVGDVIRVQLIERKHESA